MNSPVETLVSANDELAYLTIVPSVLVAAQDVATAADIVLARARAVNQLTRQQWVNWYPEMSEDGIMLLNETPGIRSFSTVGLGPCRGKLFCLDDRDYVVSRSELYAVNSSGVAVKIDDVPNIASNSYVSMAASPTQLLIIVDGSGFYVESGVLTQIADPDFPDDVIGCDYADGYFIVCTERHFFVSSLNDVTAWDALELSTVQASTNTLVAPRVHNRRLMIFGTRIAQIFDNAGNIDFPYQADPSGIIAYGLAAKAGVALTSKGFMYLSADGRGHGIVVNSSGSKVSTSTVDFAIQGYDDISDCAAFSFQANGHEFVQFSFPSAGDSWRFDMTTGLWHEAAYWNTGQGRWEAHLALFHGFAFGRHLTGSRVDGTLGELAIDERTDLDAPIRRVRRYKHYRQNHKRLFIDRVVCIAQAGEGLPVASSDPGYDPKLILRFSSDGGRNFGADISVSIGKSGQYEEQAIWTRVGSGYDCVFETEYSGIAPLRLLDELVVDISVGTN